MNRVNFLKKTIRKVKSWIKIPITMLLVFACTFELGSFVLTKYELLHVNLTPSIYKSNNRFPNIVFGRTEKEIWGSWNTPNSTFSNVKDCFDISLSFNEIGARDDSFHNLPNYSLFLIGDSFAEGYGVEKIESSEYFIEKELGVPVLNFGASGDFGPLQQYLIYNNYNFLPHQGLIIYILPDNDFTDNDVKTWMNRDQTRFRPYFNETGNPLNPYYFPKAIPRDGPSYKTLKQIIRNYFWSANTLRSILIEKDLWAIRDIVKKKKKGQLNSYFYDANHLQQTNLIDAYEGILDSANNRDVIFVIIPTKRDIMRWKSEPDRDSYKRQHWYSSLESFEERVSQNVAVINLLEYLPNQIEKLFLICDGHWSPYGNKWVSDIIINHIKNNNFFQFTEMTRR